MNLSVVGCYVMLKENKSVTKKKKSTKKTYGEKEGMKKQKEKRTVFDVFPTV